MSDNKLSDEDKALFRQTMLTVKPLKNPSKRVETKDIKIQVKPTPKVRYLESQPAVYSLSNHYSDPVNSESILSYCKQSIPRKRLNQLKNGKIPWDARFDLHGLKPDAAHDSLCHFIEQQTHTDNRCLLIIHGKGGLRGEAPILKNLVNHWLQQLPQILAFHSALPRDGGSGALYVLLQRKRVVSYNP